MLPACAARVCCVCCCRVSPTPPHPPPPRRSMHAAIRRRSFSGSSPSIARNPSTKRLGCDLEPSVIDTYDSQRPHGPGRCCYESDPVQCGVRVCFQCAEPGVGYVSQGGGGRNGQVSGESITREARQGRHATAVKGARPLSRLIIFETGSAALVNNTWLTSPADPRTPRSTQHRRWQSSSHSTSAAASTGNRTREGGSPFYASGGAEPVS